MYKRTINIASLGVADNAIPTDVICPEQIGNIPVFENSGYTVIAYSTYKEIFGRLANLLTTGTYYEIRKRGERFVLKPEYLSNIVDSWEDKKSALIEILNKIIGVYENEYWVTESAANEQCGKLAVVSNDFEWFIETFEAIENAVAFLNLNPIGGPTSNIILPIYISQDIFDLGTYTAIIDESDSGSSFSNEDIYEDESGVTDYAESKLKTLLREKRSYDNEGNLLPYVIENEHTVNEKNELPYRRNAPCSITYEAGAYYYNVLEHVTYYIEDGNGELIEDSNSRDEMSPGSNPNGSVIPDEGVIEFKYRVGNSMDLNQSTNDGILYTERRRYTLEMGENGRLYINVSDETITMPAGVEPGVQYAEISDVGKTYSEEELNGWYIKEPHLIGVHESNIDVGNVYVDRGTSASYEAFNVLGEVNSIDDIEKYRDDWYRIKGKND